MPIKLSGPLSGTEIATEFVDTVPYSLSEFYKGGALVPNTVANVRIPISGVIKFSDFYGASRIVDFIFTVASSLANVDLRTLAFSRGWDGTARIKMTINAGVYISATVTGQAALRIIGPFPNGVEITNNGIIAGMGGAGGAGSRVQIINPNTGTVLTSPGSAGGAGGPALQASAPAIITNNGIIAGGGGGGGGGRTRYTVSPDEKGNWYYQVQRGGGGGGGRSNVSANSAGGAAGVATGTWQLLYSGPYFVYAGSIGTVNGGGGGGRGDGINGSFDGGVGGGGGGWGAPGGSGSTGVGFPSNVSAGGPYAGGAGGAAVLGNANITWAVLGTRLGAVA